MKPAETFAPQADGSRHDVATPATTPPPSPPPQPSQQAPTATPPPSPPPAEAVKAGETLLQAEQQAAHSKSPQPWGNPDSPGPELNPNFEEPSDLGHTQPKPL